VEDPDTEFCVEVEGEGVKLYTGFIGGWWGNGGLGVMVSGGDSTFCNV